MSKSTVSAVCDQVKYEYAAWAGGRLDGVTLDYLFLDASFFRMHPGSPAEPVLAAWGITTGGKPAFIGLAHGSGESADAWHDFLADLKDRCLASALLVIRDGAPGPDRRDQAGLSQGTASTVSHSPGGKCSGQGPGRDAGRDQGRLLAAFRRPGPDDPARPPLAELVNHRITETAGRYATSYPAAMKCLLADHEGLTAYLRFPGHLRRSLLDPPRRLRPRTAAGSQDGGTGQNVSVIA